VSSRTDGKNSGRLVPDISVLYADTIATHARLYNHTYTDHNCDICDIVAN